ncbi:MAG: dockerin type I repeat-containing protein [Clostridia bacterium]|nr:dockerin type I repeat-containing protein [Clostridia bacterium]
MKNKFKFMSACVMTGMIGLTSALYAATTSTYDYELYTKYNIVTDGQEVTIPSSTTFSNGTTIDLGDYKEKVEEIDNQSDAVIFTDNKISFDGVFITSFFDEYKVIVSDVGTPKSEIDYELLKKYDLAKYFLVSRNEDLVAMKNEKASQGVTEDRIKYLDVVIADYEEDVEALEEIRTEIGNLTDIRQDIMLGIPYLVKTVSTSQEVNLATSTVKEDNTIKYYLYTTIYRDLRLDEIKYIIGTNKETALADFNPDVYTYNVTLPATTPRDTLIRTNSEASMISTLESNGYNMDLGLSVKDAAVVLVDGKGTAKIDVTFDISNYANNDEYTEDITRTYTINFTVADYPKGDLNKDGLVNSADAAKALVLYKYNNATEEELELGDMNDDGLMNSADAAKILTVYKYGY